MKRIRIAQIGTSRMSHGNDIWGTLQKLPEFFEIVGYALPERERERFSEKMRAFNGFREMTVEEILSDPTIDAVTVETEELYLTKYAKMVVESGKHLHMEKPGGVGLREFEELIALVKEKGVVFHTGYMYRYNNAVEKILEEVENGEFGDILYVQAQMNCTHNAENRQWLEQYPGGMMFYLGCHLIDLIYRIQGEPLRITPYNRASDVEGVTSCDFGMAVLEYKNGVSFAQTTAVENGGFLRRQLVVVGSKKTAEVHPLEEYVTDKWELQATVKENASGSWHGGNVEWKSEPQDRYIKMMTSFAAMVRGEKTNPYTPDYELALYRLVMRACGVDAE